MKFKPNASYWLFFAGLIYVFFVFILIIVVGLKPSQNNPVFLPTPKVPAVKTSNYFKHYGYLSKPGFEKALSSSIASSKDYILKSNLPTAKEVINKSKLSLIKQAFAAGETPLPIYKAVRHEVNLQDAKDMAIKFGFTQEPKKGGYSPPGYYEFVWDTPKEYFAVMGGSGTGGFEYFLKGPGLSGNALQNDLAIEKAKEFLNEKGIIIDNSYIPLVLDNVSDISKRSNLREDHKQISFRKKVDQFPILEWEASQMSPKSDRLEVWIGVGGRIIYATNNSYWTNINTDNKTEYVLKEPVAAFEDIKAGHGKIGWIEEEGIETFGLGISAPDTNWMINGKLKNVEVGRDIELYYYHERKGIDQPEFYQPIYIFKGEGIMDWKDGYEPDYDAGKAMRGKKAKIVLFASAVMDDYFFESPADITAQTVQPPVYYPTVIPTLAPAPTIELIDQEKFTFILKLGVITPKEEPKRDVYLDWESVPGTVKYNLYMHTSDDKEYFQAATAGTGELQYTASVNKYLDYYFKVQACKAADSCIDSNEVFLPQMQKPSFYMKLGVITPRDDPKTDMVLSWSDVAGVVKYNVYLKNSTGEDYGAALTGTNELTYTAEVNRHNDNYFIVQACTTADNCYSSNEIFVPKQ